MSLLASTRALCLVALLGVACQNRAEATHGAGESGESAQVGGAPSVGTGQGESADPLVAAETRCPEGQRDQFIVWFGDKKVRDEHASRMLWGPNSVEVPVGRHKGERGFPLAALLEENPAAHGLEVIPCAGPPIRYEGDDLRREPMRYVLVKSKRGALKLMDLESENTRRPITKNLTALRLLP